MTSGRISMARRCGSLWELTRLSDAGRAGFPQPRASYCRPFPCPSHRGKERASDARAAESHLRALADAQLKDAPI